MPDRANTLILFSVTVFTAAVLAACGGDSSTSPNASPPAPTATNTPSPSPLPTLTPTNTPNPTPAPPPGGLYIGHYQEDAGNNPEDPMPGSFFLNLPSGSTGNYSGALSFTYIGCQSQSEGIVSGIKSANNISGTWQGPVDGLAQTGTYQATYSNGRYTGTYANNAGKQYRDLRPCIEYHIAAFGTIALSPVEARSPSNFSAQITGTDLTWNAIAQSTGYLVSFYDETAALANSANAVVAQSIVASTALTLPTQLQAGKAYIAAVTAYNQNREIGYTSMRFIK